ncbi:MAG TPA: hypothetical protein ACHBZA_03350 [Arsenophonus apicola]
MKNGSGSIFPGALKRRSLPNRVGHGAGHFFTAPCELQLSFWDTSRSLLFSSGFSRSILFFRYLKIEM